MAAGRDPLAVMPHAVCVQIFSAVECVKARARCAAVSPFWRDKLMEPSLWLDLDLTADCGWCSEVALRGATARARGQLRSLCFSNLRCEDACAALCDVAAANAALRELHDLGFTRYTVEELEALLAAAPSLSVLNVNVIADQYGPEARRVLRGTPPFAPVRVRGLSAHGIEGSGDAVVALAEDISTHQASLTSLEVEAGGAFAESRAAMDALVEAALGCRLQRLDILGGGDVRPHCAPALARLLRNNPRIKDLSIDNWSTRMLDKPAAVMLGAALRACTSITHLSLESIGLFEDPAVAAALLAGATGHPSLRVLNLASSRGGEPPELSAATQAAVGAALAALVAADAPALETLHIGFCGLGDAGLRPVAQALRRNTHLKQLDCDGNDASEQCMDDCMVKRR